MFTEKKNWLPLFSSSQFLSYNSCSKLLRGLEGVLRDPGVSRNRLLDSGKQNKFSHDS